MKRLVAFALVAGATTLGTQAVAQTSVTPPAATQCRTAANLGQANALAAARAGNTQMVLPATTTGPIIAEAKRQLRLCIDKIKVNGAPAPELSALIPQYMYVGDTVKAKSILAQWLKRPIVGSETERAEAFLSAESMAISVFNPFAGINPDAEKFARQVDAMSDSVLTQKIRAHQLLLGRYGYADIDDGIRDHARKLLALAQRAVQTKALWVKERPAVEAQPATEIRPAIPGRPTTPAFDGAYNVMVSAYSDIARAHGDFLHADSALMILDEAERVVGNNLPGNATGRFDSQRNMYKLVGTPATPISGKWWINDKDGATATPGNGKVTVIQFTAHWCVPCKNSYPGFKRMNQHFVGRPVEAVMVTNTYGFIGDKQGLSPEQEVAEDRDYYAVHHKLPFKVAINPPDGSAERLSSNDGRYAVSGIPQIVVVDRKGIIRATVVGWDKGNEKRLTALIEKILKEK